MEIPIIISLVFYFISPTAVRDLSKMMSRYLSEYSNRAHKQLDLLGVTVIGELKEDQEGRNLELEVS